MIQGRTVSFQIGDVVVPDVEVLIEADTSELEAAFAEVGQKAAAYHRGAPTLRFEAIGITEQGAAAVAALFGIPMHWLYPSVRARRAWKLYGQRR